MQFTVKPPFEKDSDTPEVLHELLSSIQDKEQEIRQRDDLLKEQKQQIKNKDQRIDQLLAMVHLMRQKRFGRSSESFDPDQLAIFDESELDTLLQPEYSHEEVEPASPATESGESKKKPKRRAVPVGLTRVV